MSETYYGQNNEEKENQSALFLNKWLILLFWITILNVAANCMSNNNFFAPTSIIHFLGRILSIVASVSHGLILFKPLASENTHYRTSGICWLICAAYLILTFFLTYGILTFYLDPIVYYIFTIIMGVVALVGEYHEYMGHSDVLLDKHLDLSYSWRILWRWYIGTYCLVLGGVFISIIFFTSGMIIMLLSAIGFVIVNIIKLRRLYETAKFFKIHSQSTV